MFAPPVPTLAFFSVTSPAHQNCGAYSQPVLSNSSAAEIPHRNGICFLNSIGSQSNFLRTRTRRRRDTSIFGRCRYRDLTLTWVGMLISLMPSCGSFCFLVVTNFSFKKNSGVNPLLRCGGYGIYGIRFKKRACDLFIVLDSFALMLLLIRIP